MIRHACGQYYNTAFNPSRKYYYRLHSSIYLYVKTTKYVTCCTAQLWWTIRNDTVCQILPTGLKFDICTMHIDCDQKSSL